MAENPVGIREYNAGDEYGINDLFNSLFDKSRSLAEWNRKFIENPASENPARWVTVAEKNGKIVGHYASLPLEMKFKEQVVTAAQPVDSMISPAIKTGVRLFSDLNKKNIKNNKKIALFGFGFPNEKAYAVGKRFLGYKDLGEMVQLFKRLSIRSAVKRRVKWLPSCAESTLHKISKTFYWFYLFVRCRNQKTVCKRVNFFDERIEKLWEIVKDDYGIMIQRTLPYLSWRYKNENYIKLLFEKGEELLGYVVVKIEVLDGARVGYILDILYKSNIESILPDTLRFFIKQDVDYVLCAFIKEDPMVRHLQKMKFKNHIEISPLPVVFFTMSPDIDEGYLKRPKNWHLTYGDIDGF